MAVFPPALNTRKKLDVIDNTGIGLNARWRQWVGFSGPLNLQKAVSAMSLVDSEGGVNDSPLTGEASKRVSSLPA
jgi:hypothetical protein